MAFAARVRAAIVLAVVAAAGIASRAAPDGVRMVEADGPVTGAAAYAPAYSSTCTAFSSKRCAPASSGTR